MRLLAVRILSACFEVREFFLSLLEFGLDHLHGWRVLQNDWRLEVLKCINGGVFRYGSWYAVNRWLKYFILEYFYPYRATSVVTWWAVIIVFI